MGFVFTKASSKFALSTLQSMAEAGADLRVILVMGSNNAVAVRDTAEFVDDVTLDECDSGLSYARQQLASQAVAEDAGNHRTEVTAAANVWNDLAPASDLIYGAIIYQHVTDDTDSPVLFFYNDGGFPKPATGSPFTVTWSADGFFQLVCV
jgi:hypothetical protein